MSMINPPADIAINASLAGVQFRINPNSVKFDYTVKTRADPTIGGKVVQVFGVHLGDLVVSGEFGAGGWEEQATFLARMKALSLAAVADAEADPLRFMWPVRGWDFLVWLKSYTTPDGPSSVALHNTIVSPQWTLTFQIVEDNIGLRQIAGDEYISRLSEGIGWKQNKYNGPIGFQEVQQELNAIGVTTISDYYNLVYGIAAGVPVGNLTAYKEPSDLQLSGLSGQLTYTQVAQIAKNAGFTGNGLVTSIAVAMAESGLITTSVGVNSNGTKDRGLWQINSIHTQYSDADMMVPEKNAAAAFSISSGGLNWKPWTTWKNGRHLPYMDEAAAAAAEVGG